MAKVSEKAIGLRENWWRILLIAIVLSVLYALVHGLLPSDNNSTIVPSVITQQGLLPMAFVLYGVLWFALLGCVFVLVQARLPGGKMTKGLTFGAFFCAIIFMVYFEPLPNVSSFYVNMAWMLGDGLPLILLGLVLGRFIVAEKPAKTPLHLERKNVLLTSIVPLLAVPLVLVIGRLFVYTVLGVYSSFYTQTAQTLGWVLAFGVGMGILYTILRPAFKKTSLLKTALFFGVGVFGVFLLLFNFAYFLIASLPFSGYLDMVVRITIDVISVTLGVLLLEYLNMKLMKTK
jgi:hypothetical protein